MAYKSKNRYRRAMKKIRWLRLVLLLILLIILGAVINGIVRWVSEPADNRGTHVLRLPDLGNLPQNMNQAQKDDLVERARQDAIAAAKATGQSVADAQKFGERAADAAKAALSRPASVVTE